MNNLYKNKEELFPIRTVSSLTGVQTVTLRAWERRYGLIEPLRTDTGHRLYSQEDVEKIRKASGLLEKGMNISQAAQILNNPDFAFSESSNTSSAWLLYQHQILEACSKFDEHILEEIYQKVLSLHPINTVTRRLIIPVLEALGNRWNKESSGIASEHFFTVFLRNKLGARFHHRNQHNSGPKLICSCLPGNQHEMGLLLFSLAADEANYQQVLLGADMPLKHLAGAAIISNVDAIVLSGKSKHNFEELETDIRKLTESNKISVFIGGDVCIGFEENISRTGAVCLGNKIDQAILILNQQLKGK